ncbi:MAG: hypothetical protein ACQEVA_03840 [Myxococcota bacterium]
MDLVDLINSRRFLGSEFLMWLWFKSECYDGMFDVPNHDRVEVVYDDRMTLEAYLAETERNMFRGGAPAYSPEARVALREGKRVQRAKLRVIKEGREWTFNIKAESLDLTSVKIPSLLSREEEEQFYERMYLVEELEEILDELFEEFLDVRLTYAWEEVMVPAMREWIASDDFMTPDDYPAAEALEGDLIQVESSESA